MPAKSRMAATRYCLRDGEDLADNREFRAKDLFVS